MAEKKDCSVMLVQCSSRVPVAVSNCKTLRMNVHAALKRLTSPVSRVGDGGRKKAKL